jgi:hypothetical protein
MGEPYLALNALQPAPRTLLANVAQLGAQSLHACEAARGLGLKILEVGKGGKEGCCATRDLVHEVLLYRVGMMGELFEEGEGVGQCRRV